MYKTRQLAKANVFDYIEVSNDRVRRRSHPGGVFSRRAGQSARSDDRTAAELSFESLGRDVALPFVDTIVPGCENVSGCTEVAEAGVESRGKGGDSAVDDVPYVNLVVFDDRCQSFDVIAVCVAVTSTEIPSPKIMTISKESPLVDL